MKLSPNISSIPNIHPQNYIPDKNKKFHNLNPFRYYKYDNNSSNLSLIFNNNSNSNFTQANFSTTIFNDNSLNSYRKLAKNKSAPDIDTKYYSSVCVSKRFPLNKRFSSILRKNKLIKNNNNNDNKINSVLNKTNQKFSFNAGNNGITNINYSFSKRYFDKNIKSLNSIFNEKPEKNIFIKDKKKESYIRENEYEMKRTKMKLFKIIKNNRQEICHSFEKNNDRFNERLNNYYHSYEFLEKVKNYHKFFHFGKKYTNNQKEIYKHFLDLETLKKETKLTSKEILNLLNKTDKKLITSDPLYFLGCKNYLYELTAMKKQKLVEKINNEDEETKNSFIKKANIKDIILKLNKQKKNTENDDDKMYDEKLIKQIINEDFDKRLNNSDSNKIGAVEKQMKKDVLDLFLIKGKEKLFENGKYYKTFKRKLPYSYTKQYEINKNHKRIIGEKKFHENRRIQNSDDNETHKIIVKYQKLLKNIYKKNKTDEN